MPAAVERRAWAGKGARVLGRMPPQAQQPPVTGMYAWYDPSDPAAVTVSAGLVTALADKSGNARNSTGLTGSIPISAPRGCFQGRDALLFEQTTAQLAFTGATASDRTFTVLSVCLPLTLSGRNPAIIGPSADAGLEIRINNTAADGKISVLSADTLLWADNDANPVSAGVPVVVGAVLTDTDVTIYNNLNGETDANANTFTAGRTMVLGRAPTVAGDTDRFWGWIGETMIWDSALSSGDTLSSIGYLMSRWGIVS